MPRFSLLKLVILALCTCVFLFGVHARLAVHQTIPSTVSAQDAKHWIGDHNLEVQSAIEIGSMVIWIFLWLALSRWQTLGLLNAFATPASVRITTLWQLQRFFRPPPAL
jgi:hypothetical protein